MEYCLLEFKKKYPNKYWLKYDWDNNPDYLNIIKGGDIAIEFLTSLTKEIIFYTDKNVELSSLNKFDIFLSDAVMLYSERFSNRLMQTNVSGIYLKEVVIIEYSKNKKMKAFLPIIKHSIDCINDKESIYDTDIGNYLNLLLKSEFKTNYDFFCPKLKNNLNQNYTIVSDRIVKDCTLNKITGLEFSPFPWVNQLYA